MEEGEQAQVLYDELVFLILDQRFAPNSPQWFNTGLKRAYGIAGEPQGMYYVDPATGEVVESADQYTRTQASACFIVSVEDKLLGDHSISDEFVTETKLFKGGSGTGSNFSALRAEGEKLSGGGVSSGVMSFLRGLDRNADAIKSGGTTRRAAKMVCLDINHPDIEKFITWKAREEDKALALMRMGYDGDINGEAYATVSGQNSNNSLRIDNEFMKKVDNLDADPEATYRLRGRVDPSRDAEVSVSHIWDVFNESAWRCADPAPQFSDTFNEWHTCPGGEDGVVGAYYNRLNSTNPCGEYAFLDDSSCNLASINVFRYYDAATDHFDVEGFGAAVAYTVDGGELGELEYENFNAANAGVYFHGVNIHPGSAKNKMKNAILIALEFAGMLPPAETPAHTEGYEGFYHLHDMKGSETGAELHYILRDHDRARFEARKEYLGRAAELPQRQVRRGHGGARPQGLLLQHAGAD